MNNLTNVFSFLSTVNFSALNTSITTGKTSFLTEVDKYGASKTADVSDTGVSSLSTFADANNYASCTDANFALDSYVPSNNQTYISCNISSNSAGST